MLDCISSGFQRILGYIRAYPLLNNGFPACRVWQNIYKVDKYWYRPIGILCDVIVSISFWIFYTLVIIKGMMDSQSVPRGQGKRQSSGPLVLGTHPTSGHQRPLFSAEVNGEGFMKKARLWVTFCFIALELDQISLCSLLHCVPDMFPFLGMGLTFL